MTPPTGYVQAEYVGYGVVKVPERSTVDGDILPAAVCGPGDYAILPQGEAEASDNWFIPVTVGTPTKPDKKDDA